MANNPALLSQMESNQEQTQGSPLGDALTKGVGILGDFVHSNPALLLGLGASLFSGEGIGRALSQGAKAQTAANQSAYDRQIAAQTKALEDAKFALDTKRVTSAMDVAQQNLEISREASLSKRITALKSSAKPTTSVTKADLTFVKTHVENTDVYKDMKADDKENYINYVAAGMRNIMKQKPGTGQIAAIKQATENVKDMYVLTEPSSVLGIETWGTTTSLGKKPQIVPSGGSLEEQDSGIFRYIPKQ